MAPDGSGEGAEDERGAVEVGAQEAEAEAGRGGRGQERQHPQQHQQQQQPGANVMKLFAAVSYDFS